MLLNRRRLKPRLTSLLLAFAHMDIHNCFQVLCTQLELEFCAAVIRLWKQSLRIHRPFSPQRHLLCCTASKHKRWHKVRHSSHSYFPSKAPPDEVVAVCITWWPRHHRKGKVSVHTFQLVEDSIQHLSGLRRAG